MYVCVWRGARRLLHGHALVWEREEGGGQGQRELQLFTNSYVLSHKLARLATLGQDGESWAGGRVGVYSQ